MWFTGQMGSEIKSEFVEQIRNEQQQFGEPHDFTHKQQRV